MITKLRYLLLLLFLLFLLFVFIYSYFCRDDYRVNIQLPRKEAD